VRATTSEPRVATARTADGVTLGLRRWPAAGSGRGAALLTHAMMVDGRYLGRLAAALAAAGVDATVVDWRGHGASRPPDPRRDRVGFDDYVAFDLPCAQAAVASAVGVAPAEVAVVGHSLGGLVALAALGTGVIQTRRLALIATSVWLPGPTGPRARRWLMATYAAVTGAVGYAPIRALRLGNADESAGYVEDLTGWAATGRWTSRLGIDYLAALPTIAAPTTAWVGTGDRLCRPADAAALTDRIPGAILRPIGRAHGDLLDPDHFALCTRAELAPRWAELADVLAAR